MRYTLAPFEPCTRSEQIHANPRGLMTEILTESFCERCGTRYTFESARPKTRLKGVKVLSRGLKNFVLSDDTSIDEAMAAARSETDREASAHQLDAFHKTFNFCMGCRQYTCPNCWNEAEVRCLSCAPLELPEAPVRLEDLGTFAGTGLIGEAELIGTGPGNGETAPEELTPPEPVATEAVATEAVASDAVAEAEAAEPVAADAEVVAETGDLDAAGKAAAQTTGLLKRFRPGQSIDDELAAFELERSEAGQVAANEPEIPEVAATAAETSAIAASAPIEPEPAVETPTPQAVEPEPEPAPLAAAAASDVVEQPTWRISAPDPGATAPLAPPAAPGGSIPLQASSAPADASAGPQWPSRAEWRGATPVAGLPFLGRPATPEGGIEALWAASNQELVTAAPQAGKAAAGGIQPCISCGLSLSATARFCRRCGTLQAR